jgi:nucleoside-diphosphate-sugar epimerase
MRYYVTGATGYVGRRLLAHLDRLGHGVYIGPHTARRDFLLPRGIPARLLAENSRDPDLQAVIHLAYVPTLGTRAALRDNLRVADEAIALASERGTRLVYASTIAVGGYRRPAGFAFSGPLIRPAQDDTYTYVKGAVERHVVSRCRKLRIPLSVIRIGNVMGAASTWACALLGRAEMAHEAGGYSNATGIGNLVRLLVEEAQRDEPLRLVLSTEFAAVRWQEWLSRVCPATARASRAEDPWPAPGRGRRSLGLVDGVKAAVKGSRLLSLGFHLAPPALVRRAARQLQVPAAERDPARGEVFSPVEAAVFSCPAPVPEGGCRSVSVEAVAEEIRRWARWAEFVPAEESVA